MRKTILSLIICALALPTSAQISVAKYQEDRQAAISYTFDDGLLEHYTLVFPKLKELGLKASFCIIGSKVGREQKGTPCMTWEQIREMAHDGQEISSHGYRHLSMEKITGEALRYEVQHNDTLIYKKAGVFPRTYFFPGNRKTEEALAFTSKDRVGTRTFQVSFGSKRDSLWMVHWVERLLKNGEWGVTMTHGITEGYDAFPNPQVLWNHLETISKMQDKIWIATLHDVCAYITERDNTQLDIKETKKGYVITPKMKLDHSLFQVPLTLIIEKVVKSARQGKQELKVIVKDNKRLINFLPGGGDIIITL